MPGHTNRTGRSHCAALLLAAFLLTVLTGAPAADAPAPKPGAGLRILCSTFPIYLFTRAVAEGVPGTTVDLMLSAELGCPHEYTLTPQDMTKIGAADVIVINGLGMEPFAGGGKDKKDNRDYKDAEGSKSGADDGDAKRPAEANAKQAAAKDGNGGPLRKANPRAVVLDSSKGVDGLLRAAPDVSEAKDARGAKADGEYNPHLFASPRMAARVVRNIGEELAGLDAAHADALRRNADATARRFDALADEFQKAVATFATKRIVTEHDVFDYLARDAGLEVAAVVEEEPGQEPSAAKMMAIVKRVRAAKGAVVFTEPQYPARVGETIAQEAGVPVATLDPVASGPAKAPMDYYETTMRKNLETLKRMLGKAK